MLWNKETALKKLGYIGIDDTIYFENKTKELCGFLSTKINVNELESVKEKLATLEFAPNISTLILLARKTKEEYANLYNRMLKEIYERRYNCDTSLDCTYLFNTSIVLGRKNISLDDLLNSSRGQYDKEFQKTYDAVREFIPTALVSLPKQHIRIEKKETEQEKEFAKKCIDELKKSLRLNVINVDFKKASNE
jgi:hypothetical protein